MTPLEVAAYGTRQGTPTAAPIVGILTATHAGVWTIAFDEMLLQAGSNRDRTVRVFLMRFLVGSLLAALLASPAVAAEADDTAVVVQVEVVLPTQGLDLADPDAAPVRVELGEDIELILRVFASDDLETPVPVDDSSALVEIHDAAGVLAPMRFADMNERSPGVYTTSYSFSQTGEFVLVVQPGVEGRTTLHPESTGDVRFIAGSEAVPPPADTASAVGASVAVGLLILLVVGLVVVATRKRPGRRHEKKAPGFAEATKGSWWGS